MMSRRTVGLSLATACVMTKTKAVRPRGMKLRIFLCFLATICLNTVGKAQSPDLHVFAPGVISGKDVFAISIAPDGRQAFFCETDRDISYIQIKTSHLRGGKWSEPEAVAFSNRNYRDIDPVVSADGKNLYFNSNRPPNGEGEPKKDFDVWMVDKAAEGWSAPHLVSGVNSSSAEISPSLSRNGNLYFTSDRPGGAGEMDLFVARRSGNGFAAPENLKEVNTKDAEMNVAVSPDESLLVFARRVGETPKLFLSERKNGHWQPGKAVGAPIRSEEDAEYAPAFSPDGKRFYYTSTRMENRKRVKPGTIYWVETAKLREWAKN
jgi:Tol biopolymer transport system component